MLPEHRTVIIVGEGPAGLPLAVVLDGWPPYFRISDLFRERYSQFDAYLSSVDHTLLGLDFQDFVRSGVQPVELGGLWNNMPRNLLTLSPGQWMEFGFYSLYQHCQEQGIDIGL